MESSDESKEAKPEKKSKTPGNGVGQLVAVLFGVALTGLAWMKFGLGSRRCPTLQRGCDFCVAVKVIPRSSSDFIVATRRNRDATRSERGSLRFDIYQSRSDSTRFILHEVYRSKEAEREHKMTAHYQEWRNTVESMMAKRRKRVHGGVPPGYDPVE